VILFGIRGSAYIINPILLATLSPSRFCNPRPPDTARHAGLAGAGGDHPARVLVLGVVIATVFFLSHQADHRAADLRASASQQASEDLSADSATSEEIEQVPSVCLGLAGDLLGGVINMLVQFGLALGIFFFMIAAALALPHPPAWDWIRMRRHQASGSSHRRCAQLYGRPDGGQPMVGLGDMIVLLIMGIPYALLWGLLAWFMGYIPSIGFWIAMIRPFFWLMPCTVCLLR